MMRQRQRCEGRVGSTSKRAADHDHVCRRPLQHFAAIISFDAAAEEGYSWGRGLVPRPIISGRLQLTPVKTSLLAFALFLRGFCFCFCEEKMKQKWTNVLLLLVFYQSEFGRTLNLGPLVPLESSSVGLVGKKAFVAPFRNRLWGPSAAGTSEGRCLGGHRVSTQ